VASISKSAGFGSATTDHFIVCSNFRASASKAESLGLMLFTIEIMKERLTASGLSPVHAGAALATACQAITVLTP
jgi:hypothetical protein